MGEIKLFRIGETGAQEMQCNFARWEKDLPLLIERRMETLFGIRFLGREYGTGKFQRGHIDSLGLDAGNCPVILEYKRRNNDNVITQALFYLDWLLDHKFEFKALVARVAGAETASKIEFEGTRLICIASGFSRYDERAINQIGRNIELVRYRFFEPDLLLLEQVASSCAALLPQTGEMAHEGRTVGMGAPLQARIASMSAETERLYLDLLGFVETLGDDVGIKYLKHYIAVSRGKNFAAIEPGRGSLKLWLTLDPESVTLEEGFSRNVRNVGHHGAGDLELDVKNGAELEKSLPLLEAAYRSS